MFAHCNSRFRANEIQFLADRGDFINRKLEICICPICDKTLARLIETRVQDGKVFDTLFTKSKAKKIINECKNDILYSSLDLLPKRDSLYGFRYGENKETINKKTGEITITQKAVDFNGNKEVVKKYTKSNSTNN